LVVTAEEIIRPAQTVRCQQVAVVKAQRALEPGQGLRCPARPHQDVSSRIVTIDIARVDLERVADLPEREIVTSLVQVDKCEQAVGARRHRIERPGFLRERFGLLEFFLTEFRPSRNDGFEMRAAERGIGLGILRVKVDRGWKSAAASSFFSRLACDKNSRLRSTYS